MLSRTAVAAAIAEYWSDGPPSEQPPGHWNLLAQWVSHRDHHDLDADVRLFFTLNNALLDASIVAWDAKRAYDRQRHPLPLRRPRRTPARARGRRAGRRQVLDLLRWGHRLNVPKLEVSAGPGRGEPSGG
jgi:hypothetical protein